MLERVANLDPGVGVRDFPVPVGDAPQSYFLTVWSEGPE
jgi:hypothetical protein